MTFLSSTRRTFLVLPMVIGFGFSIGCRNEEHLRPLDQMVVVPRERANVRVNFCTKRADVIEIKKKYVFILDKSGSNARNYKLDSNGNIIFPLQIPTCPTDPLDPYGPCLGTDPDGSRRYPDLINFLNTPPDNDLLQYYSLINFNDTAAVVRGFTNNRLSFKGTVDQQYCPYLVLQAQQQGLPPPPGCSGSTTTGDQGATNYQSALDAAYNLIQADIGLSQRNNDPIASAYIIVFISDGFPILGIDPVTGTVTAQSRSTILQRVTDIMGLRQFAKYVDDIIFFTGYYFVNSNKDPKAGALLQDMADTENGVSFEFGTGQNINFSYFSVPPRLIKYNLSNIIVNNESVSWWDNGRLSLDTDMDGIPDESELLLGLNPRSSDTNGDGMSDLIQHRTGSGTVACTYSRADNDFDGLSDCEEALLGNVGGILNSDSNLDFIPDGLQYKNRVSFESGTTPSGGDNDFDGQSNFSEIMLKMPPFLHNKQLLNPKPYHYDLSVVSTSNIQDCFQLVVSDIITIGPDNMISVSYFERTSVILNTNIFHNAKKRFNGNDKDLEFQDVLVEPPGVWRTFP